MVLLLEDFHSGKSKGETGEWVGGGGGRGEV